MKLMASNSDAGSKPAASTNYGGELDSTDCNGGQWRQSVGDYRRARVATLTLLNSTKPKTLTLTSTRCLSRPKSCEGGVWGHPATEAPTFYD